MSTLAKNGTGLQEWHTRVYRALMSRTGPARLRLASNAPIRSGSRLGVRPAGNVTAAVFAWWGPAPLLTVPTVLTLMLVGATTDTGDGASVLRLMPELLTVREAARIARIGRNQMYEAIRRGDITAIRLGRSLRIPKSRLLEELGIKFVFEQAPITDD